MAEQPVQDKRPPTRDIDPRVIADRVYKLLQEELAREAARRGHSSRSQ